MPRPLPPAAESDDAAGPRRRSLPSPTLSAVRVPSPHRATVTLRREECQPADYRSPTRLIARWGIQEANRDNHGTEHHESAGEEHCTQSCPPRYQSQGRAAEPKRDVEERGVGPHDKAAAFWRCAADRFDP